MTNLEVKTAIATAEVMGTKSAMEGKSRVPHHNDEFRSFLKTLDLKEPTVTNFRIAAMISESFADNYTMQLLKMAAIK